MRVLITGGAGFIGAHLARRLVQSNVAVRVLDNLSSGDPSKLPPEVSFNRGDVRDVPKLWSLLQGVDVVYHLAALVSVPASVLYPREYNDVNVGGTVALLEACRDVGVKRVVLASSATVYGDQPRQPVTEDMPPNPAVPYAVSKMAAERYLFTIGRLSGFETVALRIFNAYGPEQPLPPTHAPVIPLFMQQIIGRGSVVIFGSGKQTRDYVYIDDVVDALVSAATAPNVDQEIINVGSGEETSMMQLVEQISATVNARANIIENREASGGIEHLVADLTKARQLLKYKPRTRLGDGLRKFYELDPRFNVKAGAGKVLTQ
ncbi:NAD-dependent epimerase/dehydratase family protein [Caldilinea sp.]|uniref:NAD-dependent epimerase/dehydratase family protein n=1 Tax=Caldilinea sp. TaxID=2293560 RepID=UPI0021DC86D4|nr:NAD-dependent epimerase/dehydratase family protein [Caldilinea sp.]GIV70572.1 MAG: NDP-sugar dehydratase or epimerase [Caldilinea sp.]